MICFSVQDHKNATQCVSSYLLSNPKDQNMINNKEYYINELGMQDSEFMPRSEALSYYRQIRNEQKLLDFINTSFTFDKKVCNIHLIFDFYWGLHIRYIFVLFYMSYQTIFYMQEMILTHNITRSKNKDEL